MPEQPQTPAEPQPAQPPRWRCPYCQSTAGFYDRSEITTAGMIFAVVLLLFLCLPLFWIGFFMTEDRRYCAACHTRIS